MAISFDNAFGIHVEALAIRNQRAQLIAENLANTDTPDYKARDLDFRTMLANSGLSRSMPASLTHARHLPLDGQPGAMDEPLYRIPRQPSLDGNTVDSAIEQAVFAQNAIRYQASLQFLNSRIHGLRLALRGE